MLSRRKPDLFDSGPYRRELNSQKISHEHLPELAGSLDLEVDYRLSIPELAEKFGIKTDLEPKFFLTEKKDYRVQIPNSVYYRLFRFAARNTGFDYSEELRRSRWYVSGARMLLHFSREFKPEKIPYPIVALGSRFQLKSSVHAYSCLAPVENEWMLTSVLLYRMSRPDPYLYLAWSRTL